MNTEREKIMQRDAEDHCSVCDALMNGKDQCWQCRWRKGGKGADVTEHNTDVLIAEIMGHRKGLQ